MNRTPIKTIKPINAVEVAKYYLEVEFSKLFKVSSKEFNEEIVKSISELKDKNVWGLLEAMSFTYHLNGVFYNIAREGFEWKEEVWNTTDLVLTGMDPAANKVIFSEEIKGDAIKFKKYLTDYFNKYKNSGEDPEKLLSYLPSNKKIFYKKIIAKYQDDQLRMLDGSHRLIEMLLNDVKQVTVLTGYPIHKNATEQPKTKTGKGLYILLTILYKHGDEKEKEAIITTLKQLVKFSSDGADNAVKYWITNQHDTEIKKAGEIALKEYL